MRFSLIVAMDKNSGIGKDNGLPWPRIAGDMNHFHDTTTNAPEGKKNAVIMGRKTWESLPEKVRPMKDRVNLILTRQDLELPEGVLKASSFDDALDMLEARNDVDRIWVIGGANVYAQALEHPGLHQMVITQIDEVFDCDAFFPAFDSEDFHPVAMSEYMKENDVRFRFLTIETLG